MRTVREHMEEFERKCRGPVTVKDIVADYLRANGYDGLCSHECGCLLGDFMPCQQPDAICRPGYLHPGDSEADWYVREEKPASPQQADADEGKDADTPTPSTAQAGKE